MRRWPWIAGTALAGLLAALPGFAAGSVPGIGISAAIRNVVQLKIITEQKFRPAILREPIHIGDNVTSGPNSALQVLLKDQTVFTVGANARMTVDRFVYDPDRGTGALAASVARGAFRFMSGRAAHTPGQVAIRTPVASIGVRGTIVEVLVGNDAVSLMQAIPGLAASAICRRPGCTDPTTATLVVLRGPGPRKIGNDRVGAIDVTANGRTLLVTHAGVVVVPGPGEAPLGPFPLPPAIIQYLDATLSTAPSTQTQREHIASIRQSLRAAIGQSGSNAALALAQVVLDEKATPVDLQAALAAAAADFAPGSRTFDLLKQMSYVVMQTTNAPSVDDIGHELAGYQGTAFARSFSGTHDLGEALSQVVTYRTASVDAPPRFAGADPVRGGVVQGDTLLAQDVVPLIRETPPAPQASPFG